LYFAKYHLGLCPYMSFEICKKDSDFPILNDEDDKLFSSKLKFLILLVYTKFRFNKPKLETV
jgi:hypothetical protein